MGANACKECSHPRTPLTEVSSILPLGEGPDEPSSDYAHLENVKYEVPCDISHILS